MATKENWLEQANRELQQLQKQIAFVSALSATMPRTLVLVTLDYNGDKVNRYLIEPVAFNHLSIRGNTLATDNPNSYGQHETVTLSYCNIGKWEIIPETDLPLYMGWAYTGPALAKRLRKT